MTDRYHKLEVERKLDEYYENAIQTIKPMIAMGFKAVNEGDKRTVEEVIATLEGLHDELYTITEKIDKRWEDKFPKRLMFDELSDAEELANKESVFEEI